MVAAIGAVAGVAGAAINANSASNAAAAQSGASDMATMAQMMAQAQMREDLKPWTEAGAGAQDLLSRYLGLGIGSSGVTSMGLQTGLTPDQVRQQLLSRYTSTETLNPQDGTARGSGRYSATLTGMGSKPGEQYVQPGIIGYTSHGSGIDEYRTPVYGQAQPTTRDVIDEEGLNAAIQQYYAEQEALQAAAAKDPLYGSLLRPYRDGAEFEVGDPFSFTGEDLQNEPGYQFGLNQGTQGIERAQAARGNFLSGAAMKELTRFNEDYAGTKFNDAYNRSFNTYQTNLTNRLNEWNTNLGAYNDNRNRIYNFLSGTSQMGQNSAAQVGSNNQQVANNVSNNMLATGNANAAASIASGNAWQNGLNTAANALGGSLNRGTQSVGGWNLLLANGSSDPIGSLNSQMGWTG